MDRPSEKPTIPWDAALGETSTRDNPGLLLEAVSCVAPHFKWRDGSDAWELIQSKVKEHIQAQRKAGKLLTCCAIRGPDKEL